MSTQRCVYQIVRIRSCTRKSCRPISTSSSLHKEDNEKTNGNEFEKSKNKGLFEKIKEEFIQEAENNESTKDTIEKIRKTSTRFRTQYDEFIGSKLPEFKSKSDKNNEMSNKDKLMDHFNSFKLRIDKDKIRQDSIRYGNSFREKSELTFNQLKAWRKHTHEKNKDQDLSSSVESTKSTDEISRNSKLKEVLEKTGIFENPYVQRMRDRTSRYLSTVDSKKLSEIYKTSGITEVLQKSKELSEQVAEKSKTVSDEFGKKVGEVSEEFGKKVEQVSEDLGKKRDEATEKISREKEQIAQSEAFKKVTEVSSEALKTAAEEILDSTKLKESETYRSPDQLKMRIEESEEGTENKEPAFAKKIRVDEESLGVTEHKGSKWESQWMNFKENNPLSDRILEYRIKMEESDNVFMRAGYKVVDVMSGVFRGMVEPHEISLTIAEIHKIDPNFELTTFATTLRFDIVPNVVEAYLRKDVDILENWCHERAFGQFKQMIASREHAGTIQLIDIGECDIVTGKMLDQGPVFMFNVQTQQLFNSTKHVTTEHGESVETTEESIKQIIYTMAVCRDQTMLDPTAAWTILEIIEHVTADSYV